MRIKKGKKGLSPIITTVLLITLTIVIIAIVFLWFRGMVQEGITKFGKNIQLVCNDVQFDASYSSGTVNIVNNGNVPLYRINIKTSSSGGSYLTKDIKDLSDSWPTTGLKQGGTFSAALNLENPTKITLFPVLIGTSTSGKKTFVCEGQYGKDVL
ncbi:Uncharacterised protein [uncultured archaeon]|nr:Uncharacterised protein [uncultured archaeon]